MAMNPTVLASDLRLALLSAMIQQGFQPLAAETNGEADKFLTAVANAVATSVIAHIQANATAIDPGGTSPALLPIT